MEINSNAEWFICCWQKLNEEIEYLFLGHGPTTGRCILSDRPHLAQLGVTVCEIKSWCPTEDDRLVKGE